MHGITSLQHQLDSARSSLNVRKPLLVLRAVGNSVIACTRPGFAKPRLPDSGERSSTLLDATAHGSSEGRCRTWELWYILDAVMTYKALCQRVHMRFGEPASQDQAGTYAKLHMSTQLFGAARWFHTAHAGIGANRQSSLSLIADSANPIFQMRTMD